MAKSNVVLLSMFLIVASLSLSHSLTLNGVLIGQLEIRGLLDCSFNGDLNAPPVSGAVVIFRCAGSNTTLARAVTNPSGAFTFVLNLLRTVLFDPSECGVTANLPVASCDLSPPDGVLTASIKLVNVILTSPLNIANYTTGPFLDDTL